MGHMAAQMVDERARLSAHIDAPNTGPEIALAVNCLLTTGTALGAPERRLNCSLSEPANSDSEVRAANRPGRASSGSRFVGSNQ
jgi:hypothetical protein